MNLYFIKDIKKTNKQCDKYTGLKKYIDTGSVVDNKIVGYEEYDYDSKPSRANVCVNVGDVLFAKMQDSIKVIEINNANKDFIYSTGFYCFSDKRIVPSYLRHYFLSPYFNSKKDRLCNGATMKAINDDGMMQICLDVPSIEEQLKASSVLDNLLESIERCKEELKLLSESVESQFVYMFGTVENSKYPLAELSEFANVCSSRRIHANEYVNEGIPFYRSKEIRELGNGEKPSIELFISKERYEEIKKKNGIPKKGDILIAAIGATIGYLWQIDNDAPFYYKDGNLICVSNLKGMDSTYCRFALLQIISQFKDEGAFGTAQMALTIEKVKKFLFPVPPFDIQKKFALFVNQIDNAKVVIQKQKKNLEELYEQKLRECFEDWFIEVYYA